MNLGTAVTKSGTIAAGAKKFMWMNFDSNGPTRFECWSDGRSIYHILLESATPARGRQSQFHGDLSLCGVIFDLSGRGVPQSVDATGSTQPYMNIMSTYAPERVRVRSSNWTTQNVNPVFILGYSGTAWAYRILPVRRQRVWELRR